MAEFAKKWHMIFSRICCRDFADQQNFERLRNREDSSNFDDFWTVLIAMTRSIFSEIFAASKFFDAATKNLKAHDPEELRAATCERTVKQRPRRITTRPRVIKGYRVHSTHFQFSSFPIQVETHGIVLWLHFFWPTFWLHCILYFTYRGGFAPHIGTVQNTM